jgi:hypothetical protein
VRQKEAVLDCCNFMRHAQQSGTDNEGYGALVNYFGGSYSIGSFTSFEFCPWCGKPVSNPK